MAKLQIPTVPRYKTKLPSNGKEVTFRPITTREESFLLMAKETKDPDDVRSAIEGIIENCVSYPLKKLTVVDVEWLFLQIRMKSVSDNLELFFRCVAKNDGVRCNTKFEHILMLDQVGIVGQQTIEVHLSFQNGDYVLVFGQPLYSDYGKTSTERYYSMLVSIFQPDGSLVTKDDVSVEEFAEFIQTFTDVQVQTLRTELAKIGALFYSTELVCPKCGTRSKVEYKGLSDFFI